MRFKFEVTVEISKQTIARTDGLPALVQAALSTILEDEVSMHIFMDELGLEPEADFNFYVAPSP